MGDTYDDYPDERLFPEHNTRKDPIPPKGQPRPWDGEWPHGRMDVDGVEWRACDPYPLWYRHREDGKLILRQDPRDYWIRGKSPAPWADGGNDKGFITTRTHVLDTKENL